MFKKTKVRQILKLRNKDLSALQGFCQQNIKIYGIAIDRLLQSVDIIRKSTGRNNIAIKKERGAR